MIKLAIVGYRDWHDYNKLCTYINNWKKDNKIEKIDMIVSGGCSGVDKLAEKYAKDNKIELTIFLPDWKKFGKSAGPIRNKLIVENSTHVLALVHPNSKGTWDTINKAKTQNIAVTVVHLEPS